MEIYGVDIKAGINPETLKRALALVDNEKRVQISRFRNLHDATRTLTGFMLMKNIACLHHKLKLHDIVFVKNDYGKPVIQGMENFHFNLSHSENWVVYAMDTREIGIDIEYIKPVHFLDMCESFFSSQECEAMHKCHPSYRLNFFYELWTLKESYIKAKGKGLSIPLDSFHVVDEGNHIFRIQTNDGADNPYSLVTYNIDACYKMAVCASTNCFPEKITILNLQDVCQTFIDNTTG